MAAPPVMLAGDCRLVLPTLPADSVHCCVTSPPYWGLRDYGTGRWEGGDPDCDHRSPTMRAGRNEDRSKLAGSEATNRGQLLLAQRSGCGKCGAVKVDGQIGLEASVAEYVAELVGVFREVRRVLRPDGVLFLNLGDAYAANRTYQVSQSKHQAHDFGKSGAMTVPSGLKPKDLIGLPWRVAFALQDDGWYLRSDIIWAKPNPMPESVRDRCTRSHEYVFMLSKSATYYFDADAVRERGLTDNRPRSSWDERREIEPSRRGDPGESGHRTSTATLASTQGRNVRSVWTIATQPCTEAHFAVMPAALAERCILAGCPPGGLVLDPFAGAGTTLLSADRLQRRGLGIELNPAYAGMAVRRVTDDAPLLAWTGDA